MEELRLQEELRKARQELLLLYEIGNLIRTTLLLDEVVYLILSAVTSHEGLGYNRAILFMVDDTGTFIEGRLGIGPTHAEASPIVWKMIEENKITLEGLLDVYRKAGKKIDVELNRLITQVRIPIEKNYGVLANTVIHDKPAVIAKPDAKHELSDLNLINLGITEFIVVPMRGKDNVIGVLLVDNITTKKPLTESDVRRIMMLANHAGLALENAKTYNEVVITSQQDSLTKLWNHGHFQNILNDAVRDAKLKNTPLSLIVFDIDDFKQYNDSFGHQAGDKALEAVSNIAKTVMRRMDNLARYGGEEFVAILPGTSKVEAMKLAERMRDTIERETAAQLSNGLSRKLTVSVGVSSYPEDALDKDKLIFCADGALYEAKRAGKNRVRVYKKPVTQPTAPRR
jgi:diguanylate cyclase (GGDEF)-like protein